MIRLRLILDWDMVMEHYSREYERGPGIEPESLPLSSATIDALWARYSRWSTLFLDSDDEEVTPLDREVDWRLLERDGLELWQRVRKELGSSYRVLYYSEIFHHTFESLEEYYRTAA